jgi:predicted Zn finger-like uncharacterized protein
VTTQKTRCPYCSSVFAVTDAQLAIRDGYTRCGKCFQVFKADDYLIQVRGAEPSLAASPLENKTRNPSVLDELTKISPPKGMGFNDELNNFLGKASPQSQPSEVLIVKQPILTDDQKAKETLTFRINPNLHSAPDLETPKSRSVSAPIADRAPERPHSLGKEFNEQWLNETIAVTKETRNQSISKTATVTPPVSPAAKILAPALSTVPAPKILAQAPVPKSIAPTTPSVPTTGHKVVKKDIHDVDDDLMGYLNKNSVPAASIVKIKSTRVLPGMNDFHANQRSKKKDQSLPMHFNAPKRNVALDKLKERKPLFDINVLHTLGWFFVSLLLVALLAAQYIFFNFDQLAANPRYQPLMHKVCLQLNCDVPLIDISKIKINKAIARHYPANPTGATKFTATMTNSSTESQPYPTIRLIVLKNKQVLSGRILRPSEYVKSGYNSQLRIIPNHPVEIEFVVKISRDAIPVFALDPVL